MRKEPSSADGTWCNVRVTEYARAGRRMDAESTHLDLRQETTVRRDAVAPVLHHMERVLPRELVMLHDKHDDEGGREADAA